MTKNHRSCPIHGAKRATDSSLINQAATFFTYIVALAFLTSILFSGDAFALKRKHRATQRSSGLPKTTIGQSNGSDPSKDRYKKGKRLKYVSPPADLTIDSIPLILPISDEVVSDLAKGKIDAAVRTLRTEPPSAKSIHLLREAQKIQKFKKGGAPKFDQHQFYQNIGIAYHNLFLFLKRGGLTNKGFYKNALKYYKKASKGELESEVAETSLLIAGLQAANGETENALATFSSVNVDLVKDTERGIEYLATYYSAIGDTKAAVDYLVKAYELNQTQTVIWVAISDDFYNIENDPEFYNMANKWKSAYKQKIEKKNLEKLKKSAMSKKKAAKSKKKAKAALKKP